MSILEKSKNKSSKQKRLEKKQEEDNKLKKQEDIKSIVENIENLIESYKDNKKVLHENVIDDVSKFGLNIILKVNDFVASKPAFTTISLIC